LPKPSAAPQQGAVIQTGLVFFVYARSGNTINADKCKNVRNYIEAECGFRLHMPTTDFAVQLLY
jgi:hypothetical protein